MSRERVQALSRSGCPEGTGTPVSRRELKSGGRKVRGGAPMAMWMGPLRMRL
jgi:hypothetical protein